MLERQRIGICTLYAPYTSRRREGRTWREPVSVYKEPLAKLLGSRLGSVLRFSGVKTPLSWISTACSGPEGPAASQETETKGIDVFSTERRDTGG